MKKIRNRKRIWSAAAVACIALVCCIPLMAQGIEGRFGQDLGFHLMRIEGIAQELKKGIFPVKMQSLWMDGYGYPVSVYYGDLLLYFPALFRLMGIPVVTSYKLFVVLVNLGTAAISFFSFRSIFNKSEKNADVIGMICTIAYMTAGYRLLNVYVRAAVGEYCAMMFLPLVAMAVWNIYRGSRSGIRDLPGRGKDSAGVGERYRYSLPLSLGLTGLIGTHLLTTEMTGVLLVLVGLLFWRKTFSRQVFPTLLLAFVQTVFLNLYFLIPFLDYYFHVPVYLNRVMGKTLQIQEKGADLNQLVNFWSEPFHQGENSSYLLVTPGLLLLAALFAAVFLGVRKKCSGRTMGLLGGSAALLLVSSQYFPWDALAKSSFVGQFLAQVQFPWRYMGPAVLLLCMLLGSLLEEKMSGGNSNVDGEDRGEESSGVFGAAGSRQRWAPTAGLPCLIACAGVVLFTFNYVSGYEPVYYSDTDDLDTWDMGMIEYLRYGTKREELSGETLTQENEDGSVTAELPVISYPGYHVVDSDGNEYNIKDGENNVIQVTVPAEFDGTVLVYFKEPWYWRAAEVLSLLTVIVMVGTDIVIRFGNSERGKRGRFDTKGAQRQGTS